MSTAHHMNAHYCCGRDFSADVAKGTIQVNVIGTWVHGYMNAWVDGCMEWVMVNYFISSKWGGEMDGKWEMNAVHG